MGSATVDEFRWLLDGEVGVSSMTIWSALTGEPMWRRWRPDRPHDPDDLRRCVLLLDRFPHWRERLQEVADLYPAWTELVAAWPELEALLRTEMAERTGRAPRTYARMREVMAERCLCGRYRMDEPRADGAEEHERNACGRRYGDGT